MPEVRLTILWNPSYGQHPCSESARGQPAAMAEIFVQEHNSQQICGHIL